MPNGILHLICFQSKNDLSSINLSLSIRFSYHKDKTAYTRKKTKILKNIIIISGAPLKIKNKINEIYYNTKNSN